MTITDLFGRELPETGRLDLSGEDRDRFGFVSGSSTHADRLAEIRATWENDRVLIDPHTADGVHVARRLLASGEVTGPVVVLETVARGFEVLGSEDGSGGRIDGFGA